MTVRVLADADTDIIMLNLDEGQSGEVDYTDIGGLPNTKQTGTKSGTGDIFLPQLEQEVVIRIIVLTMTKKKY